MSRHRHARLPRSVLTLVTAAVIATALASAAPASTQTTGGHATRSVDVSNPDERTLRIMRAQERYLASYGSPQPQARSTTTAADGDAWTLDGSLAVLFMAGAAGAGVIAGRASTHLRRAST